MARNATTPERSIKARGEDAKRAALLEVAVALLEREGTAGLSMRGIAERAQCSTTVLYSLFGGKDGLGNALYVAGFERLSARLRNVTDLDPVQRIVRLNHAYREFAVAHPTFYRIMFEGAIPQLEVSAASRARAWSSMSALQGAVLEAMSEGKLSQRDPERFAMQLWMAAHGVVSLELAGYLPPHAGDAAALLEEMVLGLLGARAG
jgi:AcrR family transcriptional regulator